MTLQYFLGSEHETAFHEAMQRASGLIASRAVQSMLYLLTAIQQVAQRLEQVFNFKGGYINADGIKGLNLSFGQYLLVALAVNLFNGHQMADVPLSPFQAMSHLDREHRQVYIHALAYRF